MAQPWCCGAAPSPSLSSHCNWPLPACGSEPALSSLRPQPSPHPTWLLHHLLSGGSVTHVSLPIPATLTTLKQSSRRLTSLLQNPPWLLQYPCEASTKTRPSPSCPNYLVRPLSASKSGRRVTFGCAQCPPLRASCPKSSIRKTIIL